jgi:C4-dicarboxylate-specific signal transduction histidine kinase
LKNSSSASIPTTRARTKEHFRIAIREKADFDHGYRIMHLDGDIRDIHVIGQLFSAHPAMWSNSSGTMMDVTERRRAEEERQALAHANRITTMGQLTASIAHEVNQPIATARNNAASALRFLSRDPPNLEEVREALGCIVDDVDGAGDVIGGIRNLIKKAPEPRDDCLDLNEAVREVIVLTRGEALKNGVSVQMQLAKGSPFIQGDRVQLQQVVSNLILSAVEAMSSVDDARRGLSIGTGRRERMRSWSRCVIRGRELIRNISNAFSTPLYRQAWRNGVGPLDLPLHHRRTWGTVVGSCE